ncbi:MAG: argininosuccinate lyase, partial [Chloroflexota bacterium]
MTKLWGGRFSTQIHPLADQLNASITFDWRLARHDIQASLAWAEELKKIGVLSADEQEKLSAGLEQILAEVTSGEFTLQSTDEDVHTAIERRLAELVGESARKIHTGRSRNDQVMTDFLLWFKEISSELDGSLVELQTALVNRAEQDIEIIVPGYTHSQRAQPVRLAHWWLSHFWAFQRDREQLVFISRQSDCLPLGSSALAGCPYPIDRHRLAQRLGFSKVSPNSIDAVSNRDPAASFLFFAALLTVHLSRLAEALILYSTSEFGFIELSDSFTTGSSIMPQKKNPDMLELIRAKAGITIGTLAGFLSVLKGLPSAYDKDLQEDKPAVFESADRLTILLPVMTGILQTLKVHAEKTASAVDSMLLATELADFLVSQGLPFRTAHQRVGELVKKALGVGLPLEALPQQEMDQVHPVLFSQLNTLLDPVTALERRNCTGGTSKQAVKEQLVAAKSKITS